MRRREERRKEGREAERRGGMNPSALHIARLIFDTFKLYFRARMQLGVFCYEIYDVDFMSLNPSTFELSAFRALAVLSSAF